MKILDSLYYRLNKKAIDEETKYIKKISVRKFITLYIKRLTYRHDDFKIIKQTPDCIDIISWKGNKKYVFRYHKADMIFYDNYEDFISLSEKYEVNRAFYLTSGRFEEKIYKNHRTTMMLLNFNLQLVDCFHIIKKFLGLKRKWISINDRFDYFDLFSP